MRENPDQEKRLPIGSFFALPPGMPHYAFAEEDTIIQLSSFGAEEERRAFAFLSRLGILGGHTWRSADGRPSV
jgi:hypothetical protein